MVFYRKIFYNAIWRQYIKTAVIVGIFICTAGTLFSQSDNTAVAGTETETATELKLPGSIPAELLRPRREESPRYPVDMVIGPLGQGSAPTEAYDCARKAAAALLAGTPNTAVLSTVNSVFVESCINALSTITPTIFRLGGGREEPDGSVSFLVHFAGREQGIIGELFVRFDEPRSEPVAPPSASAEETAEIVASTETVTEEESAPLISAEPAAMPAAEPPASTEEIPDSTLPPISEAVSAVVSSSVSESIPAVKTWFFEDLILEGARDRGEAAETNIQRFDFSPYERLY